MTSEDRCLVRCPQCSSMVRSDRLQKHLTKMHSLQAQLQQSCATKKKRAKKSMSESNDKEEICWRAGAFSSRRRGEMQRTLLEILGRDDETNKPVLGERKIALTEEEKKQQRDIVEHKPEPSRISHIGGGHGRSDWKNPTHRRQ